ncbi:TraR/DksA C4-type zinc finger protein [Enterobacter hormaechei]
MDRNAVSAERCEECGSQIPDSRRKVIPGVKLCVDCAEFSERQAKIFRG